MTRELRQSRANLEYLAYHDNLTGLPNRRAFAQLFSYGLSDTEPYGIFSLDLDGFKEINDTHGHAVGDRMLQHVAGLLQASVAPPGQVFRWGGDEFVVVVPGMREPAQAEALLQQLAAAGETPLQLEQQRLRVGLSIGYALGRRPRNHEALLAQADHKMYRTKRRG
ncbi:GGDEF domain-containing protein [Deinococcus sp. SL84]|nr:GGDEF domain-containing protein [Deinococcus sp. SL84]